MLAIAVTRYFRRFLGAWAVVILGTWSTATCLAKDKAPTPEKDLEPSEALDHLPTLIVAGGCFWCIEAVFEGLDGVQSVVSGYAGGRAEDANYEEVSRGRTRHAESVKITYDPARVSYAQLLQVFFSLHDPTTKDRQGPDVGAQYRSAIFFASEEERAVAERYIWQMDRAATPAGKTGKTGKIVTTLEKLEKFFPAEAYHQDFVAKYPDHPYVRRWALPKLEKRKALFPERLGGVAPSK